MEFVALGVPLLQHPLAAPIRDRLVGLSRELGAGPAAEPAAGPAADA